MQYFTSTSSCISADDSTIVIINDTTALVQLVLLLLRPGLWEVKAAFFDCFLEITQHGVLPAFNCKFHHQILDTEHMLHNSNSKSRNDRWKRLCLVSRAAAPCVWTLRALTKNLLTYLLNVIITGSTSLQQPDVTFGQFKRSLKMFIFG